jgi:hypothetical protein
VRPVPKVLAVAGFKLGIVVDRRPDCLYPEIRLGNMVDPKYTLGASITKAIVEASR